MKSSKPQFVGQKVKLSDICSIVSGATPKTTVKDYWGGDIKWITPSELNDDSHVIYNTAKHLTEAGFASARLRMFPEGTVLLTTRAPIGKVAIAGEPMCCNQGFKNLVCSDAVNNEYLYRYLKNRSSELQVLGRGATFKELSKKEVAAYEINLPPLKRQLEAVEKLALVDKQVVIAKTQLDKLDSLVKSRFVDMFGDPIINPKNWQTKRLESMGELKNGVNFKSVDNGYEVKCLSVRDFKDKYSIDDMSQIGTVSLNGRPNASQMLKNGDIVFVRSNGNKALVGRCLAVFPKDEKLTFSGFCIRFRIESNDINLDYFLNCMKSDSMRKAMIGRGANIQNLSQAILSKLSIPIPPLSLQQEFVDFARQVNKARFGGMLHLLNSLSGIMHASFFSVADTD